MPCDIQLEDKFGPAVSSLCHYGFDFTLLFEEIFLCIVPIVVISALIPLRLWQLLRRPQKFRLGPFYFIKLAAHIGFITLQFIKFVVLLVPGLVPKTRATIAAQSLTLYLSIILIVLSHFEHIRSVRPSALLSLYFGVSLLFDAVRDRTLWTIHHNLLYSILFTTSLGFKLALFILESLEKEAGYTLQQSLSKETAGNVFTRSLFWWLNPLLWRGFRTELETAKLPEIDNELTSPELQHKIWARWNALPSKTAGALVKLLFSEYKWQAFKGVLPRLALTGFTFAQPFLITRIVNFITQPEQRLDDQLGNGLIAATALIYIGLAISNANAQHKTYRVITMLRGSLVSLIYAKTLSISIPTAQDSSAVTLMSTDVERSGMGLRYMHEVWASPIDIGLSIYLLEREIGPASAAPGVIFLLCSIAGLRVAGSMGQRQKLWLEAIEKRVKATSDMLSNMKEVRMGGLQGRLEQELQALRDKEIQVSKKFKNALALIVMMSYTTTAMAPVFSFGIYSFLAQRNHTAPLQADQGFTSLAIFALIRTPMALLIDSIAGMVSSIGAMQRVGEYLAIESHLPPQQHTRPESPPLYDAYVAQKETDPYGSLPMKELPSRSRTPSYSPDPRLVIATNFSAGWNEDRPFVLNELSFAVMQSSLTFIIGPVGCGKTTLLHAILGETTKNEGDLHTGFSRAAYASQAPWLANDTIRNNILGANHYDDPWFNLVVDACALRDDIARMPKGDQESVGSGGVNLSGGQQARVSVARAVYSRQRVVLFDDVMSGLDARTENSLFNNLLGPNGLLRSQGITVIFATNALHRLSGGDHIVALSSNGKILEQGPYSELTSVGKRGQSEAEEPNEFEDVSIKPIDVQVQGAVAALSATEIKGSARRTGDLGVYKYYIRTVGILNSFLFVCCGSAFVFSLVFPQYLVKWWTEFNQKQQAAQRDPNARLGYYLGAYFALGWIALAGLGIGCWHLVTNMMPRASKTFHTALLKTTLNAPLTLFSQVDVGDTVNRFSQDLQLIDMELPLALYNTTMDALSCIAQVILIGVSAKFIGAVMPAVLVVFYLVQKFYLRTARQLRLMDIEAKGPLFSGFLETLSGLASIRSYGWEAEYEQRCQDQLDFSQRPNYLLYIIQRWLNLVLDLIVAGIAITVVSIALKTKGQIDASLIAIALVNIVNFGVSIKALLENWTNLETSIGAVSRIQTFAKETKSEHRPGENQQPPPNWPSEGTVAYNDVTATWEGKSKPVIMDLSLGVQPGKRLAICGRSGSGKSSLVSALLRLLEPQEGSIMIDGLDISTLPRQELRSRLICVTQAPFLISGSVRDNVDPFSHATDSDIIHALDQVHMLDVIHDLGGLDAITDGDKMSLGQKQLICLARATLRPGSILVLDEATASLDFDTDELVQKVIRTSFKHHTIIAIAHRLQTIVDYDNVAVISDGRLAEYGPPQSLLSNEQSLFAKLYKVSAGHTKAEIVKGKKSVRHSRQRSLKLQRGQSLHIPPPPSDSPPSGGDPTTISPMSFDLGAEHEDFEYYDPHALSTSAGEDLGHDEAPLISATIKDVVSPIATRQSQYLGAPGSGSGGLYRSTSILSWVDNAFTAYSGYQRTMSTRGTSARYSGLQRLETVKKAEQYDPQGSVTRFASLRRRDNNEFPEVNFD